ncbi:MAG: GtrA family protein [Candidatus Cloacimonetes bacterium]|nr:GtrA family protein [Candidatus Cloacimonadota bacterium]MCF7869370.1 GtrA family protein [Candidatus Cloacimonadota bacterium]
MKLLCFCCCLLENKYFSGDACTITSLDNLTSIQRSRIIKKIGAGNLKPEFWKRNDNIKIQFFRYVIVGGLAFIIDYISLYLLTEFLNIYYLLSAAISFIMGLIVNYIISIKWVFQTSEQKSRIQFFVYGLIGVIGLGLNELIIWLLTDKADLFYMHSKLVAAVIVLLWNFLARRKLMMREK